MDVMVIVDVVVVVVDAVTDDVVVDSHPLSSTGLAVAAAMGKDTFDTARGMLTQ